MLLISVVRVVCYGLALGIGAYLVVAWFAGRSLRQRARWAVVSGVHPKDVHRELGMSRVPYGFAHLVVSTEAWVTHEDDLAGHFNCRPERGVGTSNCG